MVRGGWCVVLVFPRHVTLLSVSVNHKLAVEHLEDESRLMFVFAVCVYGKPRDDFSSGLHFYFFPCHILTCGPWPLQLMYFYYFNTLKMYTSKMIFTLLDLLFIKNTLISQVVFYLYVYVSD